MNWAYFPRSQRPTQLALDIVTAFESNHGKFDSESHDLSSDSVLAAIANSLASSGFDVERGKHTAEKIRVPVLYGNNGRVSKAFEADAYHKAAGFVVEVEAGRAVTNNQFLKDLFQACMMDGVDYLAIAVRNYYGPGRSNDFEKVVTFMETLFASNRIALPLKGILIIGY